MNKAIMSKVILDACVLFPMYLRDTLLSTAEAGLYIPYWSQKIIDEAMSNLVIKGKISAEVARNLEDVIKKAFPEALVKEIPLELEAAMTNDPKDRHVLAAAIATQSDIIVTNNLADFTTQALTPWNIKAQSPDDFLSDLFDEYPKGILQVLQQQCQNYKRNPRTLIELMNLLRKQIPRFTAKVLSQQ